jgi:hypothetical protein
LPLIFLPDSCLDRAYWKRLPDEKKKGSTADNADARSRTFFPFFVVAARLRFDFRPIQME